MSFRERRPGINPPGFKLLDSSPAGDMPGAGICLQGPELPADGKKYLSTHWTTGRVSSVKARDSWSTAGGGTESGFGRLEGKKNVQSRGGTKGGAAGPAAGTAAGTGAAAAPGTGAAPATDIRTRTRSRQ